ncbi:MAG: hypothetical protein M3467_04085 [Actinomycetota bacterium]|nr:hypothetical protein [Actinomycetota bacterium]
MADDPSLGELARRLEDRVGDIRDDIRQLGVRLDGKVSGDVFELKQAAIERAVAAVAADVAGVVQQMKDRDAQRRSDKRLILTALMSPLLILLLQLYLTGRGQG